MFTFLLLTSVVILAGFVVFVITHFQDKAEKAFYAEMNKDNHLYSYEYDESGYLVYTRITSLLIN